MFKGKKIFVLGMGKSGCSVARLLSKDNHVLITDVKCDDFDLIKELENLGVNVIITKNQAEEIAEKGFEEAKRVVGEYNKDTQKCEEIEVNPNNFFTRKYNEGDKVESYKVKVYAFSREDDMGNGVKIYVDKKLGKIVGATAFGD